jgi:hypothetical protein
MSALELGSVQLGWLLIAGGFMLAMAEQYLYMKLFDRFLDQRDHLIFSQGNKQDVATFLTASTKQHTAKPELSASCLRVVDAGLQEAMKLRGNL